ncbi:PAS domain S-box-containing protein/diguanylate cyclase (GGDEF)-like protein [Rhodobacter viridis]|uniref:PAS domain S-box-containing protein/diguanylate cyclase (GGDEF)-like protein n=1 Tax=Rhodobacter viridis TaxID=1054202 RepID=A0A318UBV5_9RHOB|nr:EAL domain-containing protein [Rhodobacter viridis]PYF09704.1 PAS domain S-box-containing protein/diguanylate cyclase (GGDEF)-like protein [Rhodobacter viridis]
MAVRNPRSEPVSGVLALECAAAMHWRIQAGPVGPQVVLGLGVGETPLDLEAFSELFHPDDRADLRLFLTAGADVSQLGLDVSNRSPLRGALFRLRWGGVGEDYILTCFQSAEEVGEPVPRTVPGRMFRLDAALHVVRGTLESAGMTPTSCWDVDLRSGALSVAASWKDRLGYGPTDLEPFTHDDWARMSHPEDVAGFEAPEMKARLNRGELVQYLSRSRHRAGHWVTFLSFCRVVRWDAAGEMCFMMGCDLDMTAVSTLEGALARERDRLTTILDAMPYGKIVLDAHDCVSFANPEACSLIGIGLAEITGRSFADVLSLEEGRADLFSAIEEGEASQPVRISLRRSGRLRVLQVDLVPLPSQIGDGRLLLSLSDITGLHELRQQLEQSIENARFIATHDLMTGLPDRYLMMRLLGEKLTELAREGRPMAVLCIDFDNFRLINDTLGHETADQLIKSAAKRLEQGLPEGAILARTGEGDFVVLLPGADALAAESRSWEIVRAFARPMRLQRRQCFLTVSIGVALTLAPGSSAEALLRAADMAMHQSKARGRNTVTVFSPEIGAQFERRTAVAQALHRALEERSFELHLQPKFAIEQEVRLIGAEALLRLTDAELGPISPAEFIPVAEIDGLVAAIDLEVMRLAGEMLRTWAAQGICLPLAVNINATTLDEPGHADLAERLMRVGLDPDQVTIELTETGLAAPGPRQQRNLERLRDAGYKIAIDDFGTGQSALGVLQSLPVAEIKIDRSFVRGLDGPEPARARALVRAILAMAGALDLRAIAEGVETEAQYRVLKEEGCPAMQGFLLGRPLSLRSFEARYLAGMQPLRAVATAGVGGSGA